MVSPISQLAACRHTRRATDFETCATIQQSKRHTDFEKPPPCLSPLGLGLDFGFHSGFGLGVSGLKSVSIQPWPSYLVRMALVRILVDGYSLLHAWPELAAGKPRHSAAARDELIHLLTRYQDAIATPITVFFDGAGAPPDVPKSEYYHHLEVLFSRAGQTADDMIERAAHRFQPYGDVLAVTDDSAERDTVIALGGSASSCLNFISEVQSVLGEFADTLKRHNRTERNRFTRCR